MAVGSGGAPLPDHDTGLHEPQDPTGAQILAAIEATGVGLRTQTVTVSTEMNLLRVDLRKLAERYLETEQQVHKLQEEVAGLCSAVSILNL
ncbi:hypothetical protein NDU88_004828 [Pleurodeles waltl]|uniref:Uncharacterized protein n=1 Tax=Pleurodeles waltl TaxID=8319 RepID=A0AAV7LJA8_PLEWA|nr:hypothetical protein NDU88_004828 [Pleurodeles waltl]